MMQTYLETLSDALINSDSEVLVLGITFGEKNISPSINLIKKELNTSFINKLNTRYDISNLFTFFFDQR